MFYPFYSKKILDTSAVILSNEKGKENWVHKRLKYNSFVYLKRIASSVREVFKSRFLNNCGKQKMNREKEKEMDDKSL